MNWNRRDFFKKAAAFAGVVAAGAASLSRQARGQEEHDGDHEMPEMEQPEMEHDDMAAAAMADGKGYPGGKGSMMFMRGHNMIGAFTEPPGAPADDEVDYRTFRINFEITEHELLPGITFKAFTFNGQIPGPEFRVQEGEWIKVEATNRTEEMHTIHWHGVDVPYTMDGVPMVTQDPIHPGETFVYRFQARPAGTRFYHCHWGTPLHMSSALHGAFIIESDDDPIRRDYPYQRDYTLVLESWDIDFTRREINALLKGMKQVNRLMAQGRLSPATHGFFRNFSAFKKAVDTGDYIPPYVRGAAPFRRWQPNFFGINGKCYPAVDPRSLLKIKEGEWIRVRIINGGMGLHHLHLHGHQFVHVAQDGNPLEHPLRLNTVSVFPGNTVDIMIYGDNPGFWTFHDHNTLHAQNNGIYPGGMITLLVYEDQKDPPYVPSVSLIQ